MSAEYQLRLIDVPCGNPSHAVKSQINAPCALTVALVNSGGPAEHYTGFSAIFVHFLPLFSYFAVNISSEVLGLIYLSRCVYSAIYSILKSGINMENFNPCR